MIRTVLVLLVIALAGLIYRAGFSDIGYFEIQRMEARVAQQRDSTRLIAAENEELTQEVIGLQHTELAVESRARTDLGMVREGESFFLVVDAD